MVRGMLTLRHGMLVGSLGALALAAACSSPNGDIGRTGSTGSGGAGSSVGGSISTTQGGSINPTGGSGNVIVPPPGGSAGACQQAEVKFEPKIPTVYVMVDRSGSMFDCQSTSGRENSCDTQADTAWVKLREASLSVIRSLQADVRFGFASFTGTDPAHGGTCPQLDEVAPDLNNADAIAAVYNMLPFQ